MNGIMIKIMEGMKIIVIGTIIIMMGRTIIEGEMIKDIMTISK
jgi:hypothetical protein